MELRQVETFQAVAEELSFSRAAHRLGYVQSSVSAQIAALEQDLGARRSRSPTRAGSCSATQAGCSLSPRRPERQ